jgi:phosphohistidine phosphatase
MGRVIAARGQAVDLVLCSTSARTRETFEGVRPALGMAPKVRFLRGIYEGEDYLSILRREGDGAASLLLVEG